jgi:hypothetical protein
MLDTQVPELLHLVVLLELHKGWGRWEWVAQERLLQHNLSKQVVLGQRF